MRVTALQARGLMGGGVNIMDIMLLSRTRLCSDAATAFVGGSGGRGGALRIWGEMMRWLRVRTFWLTVTL